jgi:IS66 C-terminal element
MRRSPISGVRDRSAWDRSPRSPTRPFRRGVRDWDLRRLPPFRRSPRRRRHLQAGSGRRPQSVGDRRRSVRGPDRRGARLASMCTLIVAAKMNDVDPQAWLADVLSRIADHPMHRLDDLLPWNCAAERERCKLAAPLSFASKFRTLLWVGCASSEGCGVPEDRLGREHAAQRDPHV